MDSLYEPTPLERFCNWSPVCLRVTVFVVLLVFLDVVATVCSRGIGPAGLLRLDGQHLPVFGFALVGLAERAAQNGGRLGKPALDFCITLIEFGAGDALGLVVLKGGPELRAVAVVGHLPGGGYAVQGIDVGIQVAGIAGEADAVVPLVVVLGDEIARPGPAPRADGGPGQSTFRLPGSGLAPMTAPSRAPIVVPMTIVVLKLFSALRRSAMGW